MDEKCAFPALIFCHSLQFPQQDKCAICSVVHCISLGHLMACLHGIWDMLPLIKLIACPSLCPKFSCAWIIHLSLCNEIPGAPQAVAPHHRLLNTETSYCCTVITGPVNPRPPPLCSPVATNVITLNQWDERWELTARRWSGREKNCKQTEGGVIVWATSRISVVCVTPAR